MRVLFITLLVAAFAGCASSGTSSTTTGDTATETAPAREPLKHRATPASCPITRDPGMPAPMRMGCMSDAECTAGKNGRCSPNLGPNRCTYDECAVDKDCPAGVCSCRNTAAIGTPNRCFHGTCATDADCNGGKGFCSPSAVDIETGCIGPTIGSFGYFCHTTDDECVDDGDCGTPQKRCLFDPDPLHWRCIVVNCPG